MSRDGGESGGDAVRLLWHGLARVQAGGDAMAVALNTRGLGRTRRLGVDPLAQLLQGHAKAAADTNARNLAGPEQLVDLAAANADEVCGFRRAEKKFVHSRMLGLDKAGTYG